MEGENAVAESAERPPTLDAALGDLATRFDGDLVTPADEDYREARRVWSAMANRYPAVVARCDGVVDCAGDCPVPLSTVDLWHLGGAIADVPEDATACASRDAGYDPENTFRLNQNVDPAA